MTDTESGRALTKVPTNYNGSSRLRWRRPGPSLWPIGIVPAIFLVAFFILPVLLILYESISPLIHFAEYERALGFDPNLSALKTSIYVSGLTTVVTCLVGTVVVYTLNCVGRGLRAIVFFLLLLPFASGGELARVVAWIILFSPSSPIGRLLEDAGIVETNTSLVPGLAAVVVTMVNILLPFYVFTVYAATRRIDRRLLRAANGLGASNWQASLSIYVPLALPAVAAGSLIVFVVSLGYYATPTIMGGTTTVTLPTLIADQIMALGDWPQGSALGVLLLAVALVTLGLLARFGGLGVLYQSPRGRDRGKAPGRGWVKELWQRVIFSAATHRVLTGLTRNRQLSVVWSRMHVLCTLIVMVFLILPTIVILGASVTSRTILSFPPHGFSVRWYQTLLSDRSWVTGWSNSLVIAAAVSLIATALGLGAAVFLSRSSSRLRGWLFVLALLPMIMPTVVVALGLFFESNVIGIAYSRIGIVIGHVVFAIPFAVIVLSAALSEFDWSVDRAARGLGANLRQRLTQILLPLLFPALLSAALFTFMISFTEVIYSLLMSSTSITTLPVVMWRGLNYDLNPTVAAAGGMLSAVCALGLCLVAVLRRFLSRGGTQRGS